MGRAFDWLPMGGDRMVRAPPRVASGTVPRRRPRPGVCGTRTGLPALALVGVVLGITLAGLLAAGDDAGAQAPSVPAIDSIVAGDGTLTVEWSLAGTDPVWHFDLRYIETSAPDKADALWTVNERAWTSGPLVHTLAGLTNGTGYDVQVRAAAAGAGEWSATVEGTPVDHGDTIAAATALTLDTPVAGAISPGSDADYFRLELTAAAEVVVSTRGRLDTVGELLDHNGDILAQNHNSALAHSAGNFLLVQSLEPGTYYVRVTSYGAGLQGGVTGAYVIEAAANTDTTSRSDARAAGLDRFEHGTIDPAPDEDYFTLTLSEQADMLVAASLPIELQDAGGGAVAGPRELHMWAGGSMLRGVLAAGTYHIKVTAAPRTEGPYRLWASTGEEPGNTLASALPLELHRPKAATINSPGDADYFRIDLAEATDVRLSAAGAGAGVAGRLLNEFGNPVAHAAIHTVRFGPGAPAGFVLLDWLGAGTYYLRVTRSGGASTGPYAVLLAEDGVDAHFDEPCRAVPSAVSDPLYRCQWNLHNTGQRGGGAGEDINIEGAWALTLGAGVGVAVVDDGMDFEHEDLRGSVDTSLNHNYGGGRDIYHPRARHGTQVAGVIAAHPNGLGARGVAPRATIYGYNLLAHYTDANQADAMARNMATTAVSSNSWGPFATALLERAPAIWERAVEAGIADGFDAKGVFYAFSAGNGGNDDDYATLDEYVNHYGVTAVCAVNDLGRRTSYSEMGANLWVCAPSGDSDSGRPGIVTTANHDRYRDDFDGTSAAAPQVSGVAALLRSAHTGLSWRDVKLILAASARKNHPQDAGWQPAGSSTARPPSATSSTTPTASGWWTPPQPWNWPRGGLCCRR